MATIPTIPGAAGGAVTGQRNAGIPVLAGKAGFNQYSPTSGIPGPVNGKSTGNPLAPIAAGVTGATPKATATGATATAATLNNPLGKPQAIATQPTAATATPAATPASTGNNGNTLAGYTPQQTQQLQKQLNDIYGKGEGGLLYSMLSNLGSNDSSYMDAYHQAMSKSTAEGLSTIDTGLGNAGISANSSVAAIEKGDYLSGVTAQEGMQEQQLIQRQQDEAIGLTQGLQQSAQAENSTSWLSTLAQVAGVGATLAGVPGASQGLSGLFNTAAPNPQTLATNTGADPLGLQAPDLNAAGSTLAGTIPTNIPSFE